MIGLYRGLSRSAGPFVRGLLWLRAGRGREDPERLGERTGIPGAVRPAGPLVWLHGASVGEAVSALGLIEAIRALRPDVSILVTTGTVTSARLLERRLPSGAVHQFVPVDVPAFVRRFLDHWRPDLALWIESEIWPNLLMATSRSGAAVALVNGRLSLRSFRRWQRAPRSIRRLLGCFDLCLAQSDADAARLRALGAPKVLCRGNLKHAAPPLPCDEQALMTLRDVVGDRPAWLAASTHPGEEEQAAEVHRRLRQTFPGMLTIVAPRHPARGGEIARRLSPLRVARRGAGELPSPDVEVYLADTIGELGLFYRLAQIAFVGGSLVPHGGQNPLEPARLGCAVLHGPNMQNFAEIAAEIATAGAAVTVADTEELAQAVAHLLSCPRDRTGLQARAASFAETRAGIMEEVLAELIPLLPGPVGAETARESA